MIQATSAPFVGTAETVLPARRVQLQPRSFWMIFALQAVALCFAVAALIQALPTVQPITDAPEYNLVRSAIFERATGAVVDPLTEVAPGTFAAASNVRGLSLGGVTYYYYFEGAQNFDPLSRNRVDVSQIQVVLRDTESDKPLVIYTLAH